jgi:hypothetical protein
VRFIPHLLTRHRYIYELTRPPPSETNRQTLRPSLGPPAPQRSRKPNPECTGHSAEDLHPSQPTNSTLDHTQHDHDTPPRHHHQAHQAQTNRPPHARPRLRNATTHHTTPPPRARPTHPASQPASANKRSRPRFSVCRPAPGPPRIVRCAVVRRASTGGAVAIMSWAAAAAAAVVVLGRRPAGSGGWLAWLHWGVPALGCACVGVSPVWAD